MEEWRIIEDYPNYMVSNMGRVKSLERNVVKGRGGLCKIEEKILKSRKDKYGYLKVDLYKEGKQKTHTIHRLVATAFIDNPNNLSQINHRDEDKTNNCADNLEFCTAKYNINYGSRNEKMAKSRSIPLLQFNLDGEFIKKWESGRQVQKDLGFDNSSITKCCKGKCKSVYDCIWGYEKDYKKIPFKVFDLEIYKKIA